MRESSKFEIGDFLKRSELCAGPSLTPRSKGRRWELRAFSVGSAQGQQGCLDNTVRREVFRSLAEHGFGVEVYQERLNEKDYIFCSNCNVQGSSMHGATFSSRHYGPVPLLPCRRSLCESA